MAKRVQRRRGTSAEHGSFTGAPGEITIDTTTNRVVTHDGSTAGGHEHVLLSDTASNANDGVATSQQITELEALRSSSGGSAADTNMGTYTGSILSDNTNQQALNQELETDLEALQTATGIPAESTDMGTYTGSIISDNVNQKTVNQELETDLQALQTASGIAPESTDMGTYTGDIISDNITQKDVNQELVDAIVTKRVDGAWEQGGFTFDGNDYLDGPSDDVGTSDFTVVFDLLWDDAPSAVEVLAVKGNGGNNRWTVDVTATQYRLQIIDHVGSTNTYTWTVTPSVNHRNIIVSADRSGNATLYLNGASQGTQDISATSSVDLGSGNTNPLRLGNNSFSFNGNMFQVRYYTEAKSESQVLNIAQGYNDLDNIFLKLAPTSTQDNFWLDLSGNNRSFVPNGATRIESDISKDYTSHSEYTAWRRKGGGYKFKSADYIDLELSHGNFGTNDFTIIDAFTYYASGATNGYFWGSQGGTRVLSYFNTLNKLVVDFDGASTSWDYTFVEGESYVIAFVANRDGNANCFVNGEKVKTYDISSKSASDIGSGITNNRLGSVSPNGGIALELYEHRAFNYALSHSGVKEYSRGAATKFVDRVLPIHQVKAGEKIIEDASITGLTVGDDSISGTNSSGSTAYINPIDTNGAENTYIPGQQYRLQFDYTGSTTATFRDDTNILTIDGSSGSFDGTLTKSTSNSNLFFFISNGNSINIDNIVLTPLGEVASYLPTSATESIWQDTSGLQNNAINNNATLLDNSINSLFVSESEYVGYRRFDGGYRFDGSSSYVQTSYNAGGLTSISGIVSFTATDHTGTVALMGEYDVTTNNRVIAFEVTPQGELRLVASSNGIYSSSGQVWQSASVISADTQYTAGFVLSGDVAQFFLNGVKIDAPSTIDNGYTGTLYASSEPGIAIGAYSQPANYFEGTIHEARIWNYALSDEDVKEYSRGAATKWIDRIDTTINWLRADEDVASVSAGATITTNTNRAINISNSSGSDKFVNLIGPNGSTTEWVLGRKYRFRGTVDSITGTIDFGGFEGADIPITSTGAFSYEGVFDNDINGLLYLTIGDGEAVAMSNMVVELIGETASYLSTSATSEIWEDTSGLDNHAVNNGATSLTPSLQETYTTNQELVSSRLATGAAYYFDGVNDKIDLITGDALNTNDFTWVADVNPSDDNGIYGIIYGIGLGAYSNRRYLRYNNGQYDLTIGDSSSPVIYATWPAQRAKVVITHKASDSSVNIYIDGKLVSSATHTNSFDVNESPMASNVMDVGAIGGGTFFKGEIYGVQTYNRVLTADQISQISKGQRLGFADVGADGTAIESSDFSSTTDSYVQVGGTIAQQAGPLDGESNYLQFTINNLSGVHGFVKNVGAVLGKRYRASYKFRIDSSNTDVVGFVSYFGSGNRTIIAQHLDASTSKDVWHSVEAEVINGEDNPNITFENEITFYCLNASNNTVFTDSGGNDRVYIKDVTITPIGEVLALLPESAATGKWYNEGGAGSNGDGTVSGATLINERKRGVFDNLYLDNVPSSDAGLVAGEVYRDNNGHLKIKV